MSKNEDVDIDVFVGCMQWTSAMEGELLAQMDELEAEERARLYEAVKQHVLLYEDPVSL